MASTTTQSDVPTSVQELSAAASALYSAQNAMQNNKDEWRKIAKIVREIDTCVDNTARAAHHRGERAALPVVVVAALGATRDVFLECESYMKKAAAEGRITRFRQKSDTADAAAGYLSMVEGLQELLKAQNSECGLMMDSSADFGVLVQPIKAQNEKDPTKTDSARLPDISKPWSKDDIDANIGKVDAAYDGLKSALNVMANMTDGLPWPLKAVPQTLLYILQLFEEYQDARPKITSLLYSIQQMWDTLENVLKRVTVDDDYLQRRLEAFLETLWRIVIRLHMLLRTAWVKRAMAIQSVSACLEVEHERIHQAHDDISQTFQGETLARVSELGGQIKEMHDTVKQLQAPEKQAPLVSYMNVSKTLPEMLDIFHGRDEFVSHAVDLLTKAGTTRLAVLGAGGMGKTSIAVAILHADQIVGHFGNGRFFISCEAHSDANSLIIALATLLDLQGSNDLLTSVVSRLAASSRTLLVLDNLETVWLVSDAKKVSAVDNLLSTLAKIPTLSLIITCRGNVLPPRVRWSNAATAALAPFSLEAAMQTFEDTSGVELVGENRNVAEELLRAVDRMPLAVSLLGQLAQRGSAVSELFDRWNRAHNALLSTGPNGREYNVNASIRLTMESLAAANPSKEPLQLLAVCSLLPDGLRPSIFEELREHFEDIDGARQALRDYALVSVGIDGELRMLNPIRHFTIAHHPPTVKHHAALCSIYFALAHKMACGIDEGFKQRAATATPELQNLASLLLMLVHEPSNEIVQAVGEFTNFTCWFHPNVTVACALLPYLEQHSDWKAICLYRLGKCQIKLGKYQSGLESLATALDLFFEADAWSWAAGCMRLTADAQRLLGQTDQAEVMLNYAHKIFVELNDRDGEADCRLMLGSIMEEKEQFTASVEHLTAARLAYTSLGKSFEVAQCSENLGIVYFALGDLESSAAELEAARSAFITLAEQFHVAQSTRILSLTRLKQGNLALAERLLDEAGTFFKAQGSPHVLAIYNRDVGFLRCDQERWEDAITCFVSALPNIGPASRRDVARRMLQAGSQLDSRGETDNAEALLNISHTIYAELKNETGKASCRFTLGSVMQRKGEYSAAVEHLTAAQQAYGAGSSEADPYSAARCSEQLGSIYLLQGSLESAAVELEAARSAFITCDDQFYLAKSTRSLSITRRKQGDLILADQLLCEVEAYYKEHGDRYQLANYAMDLGCLRRDQGRREEAITSFESALSSFEALGVEGGVRVCREQLQHLRTAG